MQVRHNSALSRFETGSGDTLAVCEYHRDGSIWVLPHTFVPASLRGAGVAAALVRAALEHIRAAGGTVVPSCSYVAAFIKRHPEFAALVPAPQPL